MRRNLPRLLCVWRSYVKCMILWCSKAEVYKNVTLAFLHEVLELCTFVRLYILLCVLVVHITYTTTTVCYVFSILTILPPAASERNCPIYFIVLVEEVASVYVLIHHNPARSIHPLASPLPTTPLPTYSWRNERA